MGRTGNSYGVGRLFEVGPIEAPKKSPVYYPMILHEAASNALNDPENEWSIAMGALEEVRLTVFEGTDIKDWERALSAYDLTDLLSYLTLGSIAYPGFVDSQKVEAVVELLEKEMSYINERIEIDLNGLSKLRNSTILFFQAMPELLVASERFVSAMVGLQRIYSSQCLGPNELRNEFADALNFGLIVKFGNSGSSVTKKNLRVLLEEYKTQAHQAEIVDWHVSGSEYGPDPKSIADEIFRQLHSGHVSLGRLMLDLSVRPQQQVFEFS